MSGLLPARAAVPLSHQRSMDSSGWIDLLACPVHGGGLQRTAEGFLCRDGQHTYPCDSDLPLLFVPNDPSSIDGDVTDIVKMFYEETPFPNYDDVDSRES